MCMLTERQTKSFNPAVTIWVLVYCERAPLNVKHKSSPVVFSQRQHWAGHATCYCPQMSTCPSHLIFTAGAHIYSQHASWPGSYRTPPSLSLHCPSPRAHLQGWSDSLTCAGSQLLPINDGHLALAGPCPLGLTGRHIANHSQGRHGIRKTASLPQKSSCVLRVSAQWEKTGGGGAFCMPKDPTSISLCQYGSGPQLGE